MRIVNAGAGGTALPFRVILAYRWARPKRRHAMTCVGRQFTLWDAENRPASIQHVSGSKTYALRHRQRAEVVPKKRHKRPVANNLAVFKAHRKLRRLSCA